jgi:hypothetical protein
MPTPQFEQFMEIVRSLPQVQDVVFRGHPELAAPPSPFVTTGIVPTSRNPRVATENFSTPVLLCIVSATGRVLGSLSRQSSDEEVVILPGRLLTPIAEFSVGSALIVVLDEIEASPSGAWVEPSRVGNIPSETEAMMGYVRSRVEQSIAGASVSIVSPGKFVSPVMPSPRA